MEIKLTKNILYIMADFETSATPDKLNSVYAWLTGFEVCGIRTFMEIEDTVKKRIERTKEKINENEIIDEYNSLKETIGNYGYWNDDLLNQIPIEKDFKYFYGKNALVEWLNAIRDITFICNQYNTEVCIFFHNARFDFSYIQYYILKHEGKYNKNCFNKYFMSGLVIDGNNNFYNCNINYKIRRKNINKQVSFIIRDYYKIFPSKLASIGKSIGYEKGKDFDYDMVRTYDYVPIEKEIKEYFERDIKIMVKSYRKLDNFFYGRYTIGSISKNYFLSECLTKLNKNKTPKQLKDYYFPYNGECIEYVYQNNNIKDIGLINIENVFDKIIRGYKGGMTICNKDYVGTTVYNEKLPIEMIPQTTKKKLIKNNVYHYDVNSLYPSAMSDENNYYPIGIPKVIYSDYEKDNTEEFEEYLINEMNENKKCVIIDVYIKRGKVKKGKAPLFLKHECKREYLNKELTKQENKRIREKKVITENNSYNAFYETFNYDRETISLNEFLIMKNLYNMVYTIQTAYVFTSTNKLFKGFVDYMSEKKIEYDKKHKNDPFKRNMYKLVLNNLYGKFGEKKEKETLYKQLDNNGHWLNTGDTEEFSYIKEKIGKYFYPPIALFVTSYARVKMISFINLINWKNVLYMDTDSIHTFSSKAKKILENNNCIDNSELGKLKLEEKCFAEKTLSPKKYSYYDTDNNFNTKCAGLPDKAQKLIKNFDSFHYGLTFIPKEVLESGEIDLPQNYILGGKLAQKYLDGGIDLAPCIFSIKTPEYIKFIEKIKANNSYMVKVI